MRSQQRHQLVVSSPTAAEGVVCRDWLASVGLTFDDVKCEVRAGRWVKRGNQTVAIHTGPLGVAARRWRAVWEVGTKVAALDGVTALQVAGLDGYTDDTIHVSVVHRCSVRPLPGVRLHKVIRRVPGELAPSGIPRTRPAVAALRAAYWAVSDRQAALLLVMTVQQGLATPQQLHEWSGRLRGRRRRAFIKTIVTDIADGVRSLGELDFARMCRARGLPEPTRQSVVRGPNGRVYLDVHWRDHRLVVEIDGSQHYRRLQVSLDNLRQNAVTLGRDRVLRMDLIGLRLYEDEFMDQVAAGLGFPAPMAS